MSASSMEDRVSELEKKVARLLARVEGQGKEDWISRVVGSFANCPEFDEVIRLGREFRKEQNAIEDVSDDEYKDAE